MESSPFSQLGNIPRVELYYCSNDAGQRVRPLSTTDDHMPKFEFALSSAEAIREAGIVVTSDFAEALSTIEENASIDEGDFLRIGVRGFPPAQLQCVGLRERGNGWAPMWKPHGRAA